MADQKTANVTARSIEQLASSNEVQESKLQKLRDENNRLKGEQGYVWHRIPASMPV
jgi:hypothetical protein